MSLAPDAPTIPTIPSKLPFTIELTQLDFPGAPAVQSFSWGQSCGKWLIVGGLDSGIHSFAGIHPMQNENRRLMVIDPKKKKVWSASVNDLPPTLADPLHACNAQTARDGEILYIMGGYGFDVVSQKTITFDSISTIHTEGLIQAIIEKRPITPYIAHVHDPRAKVCGGELVRLGKWFHLVFGQTFDGPYVPNDADIGKLFHWKYTEQVARFKMHGAFMWEYPAPIRNPSEHRPFHRRDFTAAPFITAKGRAGIGVYGGVFIPGRFAVFRHPIYIDDRAGVQVDTSYSQFMSQYTCASLPMYMTSNHTMYTALFGGMSMYQYSPRTQVLTNAGITHVPTITVLGRDRKGATAEYICKASYPHAMGADAAFIRSPHAPWNKSGVLEMDKLTRKTIVGHIFGGLLAKRAKGGGWNTEASNMIFEVHVSMKPSKTRTPTLTSGR